MNDRYTDPKIEVTDSHLVVHWYYFPYGSKRIPFEAIVSVQRVNMGALTGRARVWGTANPGLWAHLDTKRARKQVAYIVGTGGSVRSYITPDDPAAFEAALGARCPVTVQDAGRSQII